MRRLVYWVCPCLDDSPAYNLRARTRKQVSALRFARSQNWDGFGPPIKVVVEYRDAFDLAEKLLGECGAEQGAVIEANASRKGRRP